MTKKEKQHTSWFYAFHQVISQHKWFIFAWLAGVTFLVYHQVLSHDFVNFDDSNLIYNNPIVTQPNLPLKAMFTWGLFDGYYKPLVFLSWWTEYQVFGPNPTVFHFNNLLLHVLNVVLVYFIGLVLMGQFRVDQEKIQFGAILLATIFAIHPLHVESVAWAVERKDVLFSFFFLAGWLVYLQYLKNGKSLLLVAVAMLYLASMLSKSMGITLLPVLLLTDYVFGRKDLKKIILEKAPVVISLLVGAYLFGLFGNLSELGAPLAMAEESSESVANLQLSFFETIQIQSSKYLLWILHLIFPFHLSVIYPGEVIIKAIGPLKMLAPFLLAGLLILAYSFRKGRKELLFGLLFFLGTLVPTLVVSVKSGIGIFLSDRYTYIPMLGLFFMLLPTLLKLRAINSQRVALIVCFIPVLLLSIGAYRAVKVWENSETLWTNVINKFDKSGTAYNGRGKYYLDNGEYDKALADLDQAIINAPRLSLSHYNRAQLMIQTEDFAEALISINQFIELKPGNSAALQKRSYIYSKLQQTDLALKDIDEVIKVNSEDPSLYVTKADILLKAKRLDEALANIDKSLELSPDYWPAYQKRALIDEMRDDLPGALQDIERAIAINPKEPLLFNNKSVLLFKLGSLDEALEAVNQCLLLDPGFTKGIATRNTVIAAKENGGTLPASGMNQPRSVSDQNYLMYKKQAEQLKQSNQVEAAIEMYTKLIALVPDNFSNYVERGALYLNSGNNERAIADFTEGLRLNPGYHQTRFFRSIAYHNLGLSAKALQDAKTAQANGVDVARDYLQILENEALKE
ncbi:tetratricopeptide repeat protein [Lewinella sp. LCG006]|uniref:tetratricopeptide repeat protein n=1 Tax=Lewinella sp. LCG006 TaxID=3231911 RepID=UPI00346080AD